MTIVQSLWIGTLTKLEILCMNSFIKNGNTFHLYTYDPIENIPEGVIVKDANEIYPRDKLFLLKDQYLPFSDIWRYNLLRLKGGIWVDLDMVCVGNMSSLMDKTFVFSSERTIQRGAYKMSVPLVPNIGVLKAPIGSEFYIELCDRCEKIQQRGKNTDKIKYMRELRKMIDKYNYNKYVMEAKVFCPIDWWYAKDLFFSDYSDFREKYGVKPYEDYNEGVLTIHLWRNLATHKYKLDLNATHPTHSVYFRLTNQFL